MNITEFTNTQIYTEDLPFIEDVNFQKLEPKSVVADLFANLIFFGVATTIAMILSIPIEWISIHILKILVGIGSISFVSILYDFVSYQFKSYGLRGHDVSYRNGIIFRNLTALPFNRVQHCEIAQGPVDRYFELATLKIFTAGGSNSDLQIPGLYKSNAEAIKSFILRKTDLDEEE